MLPPGTRFSKGPVVTPRNTIVIPLAVRFRERRDSADVGVEAIKLEVRYAI
jgi:hypothetical protein